MTRTDNDRTQVQVQVLTAPLPLQQDIYIGSPFRLESFDAVKIQKGKSLVSVFGCDWIRQTVCCLGHWLNTALPLSALNLIV